MKVIQVFGPGCAKCDRLARRAAEAADALGIEYQLVKVADLREMVRLGITLVPALAVDGRVRVAGRVPSLAELTAILGE